MAVHYGRACPPHTILSSSHPALGDATPAGLQKTQRHSQQFSSYREHKRPCVEGRSGAHRSRVHTWVSSVPHTNTHLCEYHHQLCPWHAAQSTESRDTADKNKRGGQTPSPRSYSCCRPVLCTLGYLYQHQELRSISHCPLQGIFPTQGSNPGLSHCRWILCHLSHQGSPKQTRTNHEMYKTYWVVRGCVF